MLADDLSVKMGIRSFIGFQLKQWLTQYISVFSVRRLEGSKQVVKIQSHEVIVHLVSFQLL